VWAEGIVDFLPRAEFLVKFLDGFGFLVEEMVELLVVGAVGALDEGVVLGSARIGKYVFFLDAGLIEEACVFASVIALELGDGEGESAAAFAKERFGGLGGCGGESAKDPQACASVDGGELIDFRAVGEAQVLGVCLDEGAGEGFPQRLVGALALAGDTAETLFPLLREEEVVLSKYPSESGGRKADAVALLQEDSKLVLAPGGELLTKGDDLVKDAWRQRRGACALGASGAVFEGGKVSGIETAEPVEEGGARDVEMAAGKGGVSTSGKVVLHPAEAPRGVRGERREPPEAVKASRKSGQLHKGLLGKPLEYRTRIGGISLAPLRFARLIPPCPHVQHVSEPGHGR